MPFPVLPHAYGQWWLRLFHVIKRVLGELRPSTIGGGANTSRSADNRNWSWTIGTARAFETEQRPAFLVR